MPVTMEIRPDENLIVHEILGKFTLADFKATMNAEISHPEFRAGMDALWDFSRGDASGISQADVMRMAEIMTAASDRRGSAYRIAVIAPDDLHHGLTRMYAGHTAGIDREINIFRERGAALGWLRGAEADAAGDS
jgi:hypothetical protein